VGAGFPIRFLVGVGRFCANFWSNFEDLCWTGAVPTGSMPFFFGAILAIYDGIPMLDLLDVHMSAVVLEPFYCALKHL